MLNFVLTLVMFLLFVYFVHGRNLVYENQELLGGASYECCVIWEWDLAPVLFHERGTPVTENRINFMITCWIFKTRIIYLKL